MLWTAGRCPRPGASRDAALQQLEGVLQLAAAELAAHVRAALLAPPQAAAGAWEGDLQRAAEGDERLGRRVPLRCYRVGWGAAWVQ